MPLESLEPLLAKLTSWGQENSMRTFWLLNDKERYSQIPEPWTKEGFDTAVDRVLEVERISQLQLRIIDHAFKRGSKTPI